MGEQKQGTYNFFYAKVNQMRSLDLEFRPKIRIIDLDRLRNVESKKFEAKIEETIKISNFMKPSFSI